MALFSSQTPLEQSWDRLRRQEAAFIQANVVVSPSPLSKKLDRFMPDQLQETLEQAFYKAFELVFTKGEPVLNTLSRSQKRLSKASNRPKSFRRSLRAPVRRAGRSKTLNLFLSGAEGVSTGLLGVGIPDIPLFLAVILKTVYEIAASYGFSSTGEQEKCLILRIIQLSLSRGQVLCDGNRALDRMLAAPDALPLCWGEQLRAASDALARELLNWKFLQGTPVVGVVGGLSDAVFLRRISTYAELKYRRRFLLTLAKEG